MNNRAVGKHYEEMAKNYLIKNGAYILTTNYHFHKIGEIDIIYYDKVLENGLPVNYLCFCEVKYRKTNALGSAIEAVNYNKRRKITMVANGYIKEKGIGLDQPMRFDCLAIDADNIDWIKNAFYPISL